MDTQGSREDDKMKLYGQLICAVVLLAISNQGMTAETIIRVHHFLSDSAPLHREFLLRWEQAVEEGTTGRVDIEIYPGMSLGGTPADLYDQAVDGVVDVVLTLPGYTPGRFKQAEVFELPFLMEDPVATSKALWDLVDSDLQDGEFSQTKILASWVHGPGVLHTLNPVTRLKDMQGMKIRAPTRLAGELLKELGAEPVNMPLPSIPQKIVSGEITGTLIPWEVTPSIKLGELVSHHLEIDEKRAMYTAVFILAMNKSTYETLPADARAVIKEVSGKTLSAFAGEVMSGADAYGRDSNANNSIHILQGKEVKRWVLSAQPLYNRWFRYAELSGFDGSSTLAKARELIQLNRLR